MARVLIISTNREQAPQPVLPVGAAWIAQALHNAGFVVRFLDLCFESSPRTLITNAISDFAPDGIGISIRNLDNCDLLAPRSYLSEIRELIDLLKSLTGAPVLIGGSAVSIMPRQVLEFLDLDYAVTGAGEEAAVRFFRGERSDIPGLVSRMGNDDSGPALAPPVMPRLQRWVDIERYRRFEPVVPIQGKRGCANRCLYCTYRFIEGERWRPREPQDVVEEIRSLIADTGVREYEFVDSVFNQPEGYAETLLEEVINSGIKARFHISCLSPLGLTRGQVALMERAGVVSVVITPEAVSDQVLERLEKGFTSQQVLHAAGLLGASDIRALWCFLLGGPGEDEQTLTESIDFINKRIGQDDKAYLTTGIRIFPGTGLHSMAVTDGIVSAGEDLLMPRFYFSPKLSLARAQELLSRGLQVPDRCIFSSDTSLSQLSTLRRIGTTLGLPTPFWRYAGYANKMLRRQRILNRPWSIRTSPEAD